MLLSKEANNLAAIDDNALLASLARLSATSNRVTAELLVALAEVNNRKLYLAQACSSLHAYCVWRLGLSDAAAGKRIRAARTARRFPMVFDLVASGSLHLTGVCQLSAHLTEENHRDVLEQAKGKTMRQIDVLVASLAPRPDARAMIRRVPTPRISRSAPVVDRTSLAVAAPARVAAEAGEAVENPKPARRSARTGGPEPLSPGRFKLQVTVGQEARDALGMLQDLMRHQLPSGDPAAIVERALCLLLKETLNKKAALTAQAEHTEQAEQTERAARRVTSDTSRGSSDRRGQGAGSRHIPAAVKRAVFARDGGRCAFVDDRGRRCEERGCIEFHHVVPYARGGGHEVLNIELRCRAHNQFQAVLDFGAAVVAERVGAARRRGSTRRMNRVAAARGSGSTRMNGVAAG